MYAIRSYYGSIELTTSEGIKETKKGFFEVDISRSEANPKWIELQTRGQFSFTTDYGKLKETIKEILEKISAKERKPIVEIKIKGENPEIEGIQAQISQIQQKTLRCFCRITSYNVCYTKLLRCRK